MSDITPRIRYIYHRGEKLISLYDTLMSLSYLKMMVLSVDDMDTKSRKTVELTFDLIIESFKEFQKV